MAEQGPLVIFIDPANVAVFERTESAAVYSVVLSEAPTAPLCISPEPATSVGLAVSVPELCFGATDWDQPQQVVLSAVEDDVDWGDMLRTAVHHRVSSSSPHGAYRASCAASDEHACATALLDGNGTACRAAGKCTHTEQVLAREEFCVAADQALCSSIVLNGNGPTCTEHPLGTCAYTAPVEPANTTCVAVAAGNCSAVNATVEGEEACLTAGDCVYTAADAETGVPAECVAADAASCLGAIVNQTNLTLSYLEDACAGAGNCSFSPAVEEVIEKCDAVDLAVCESADLNGTASRCTLLGACAHYPEVLPVQEACAATDLAVCAAVDVLSAAADAGARDACTSAAAISTGLILWP